MKSFRKKIRESRLKMHLLVRSWLQPKLGVIGTRYRLSARIRLANRWAAKASENDIRRCGRDTASATCKYRSHRFRQRETE